MIFSFTWQIVSVCMTLTDSESMPQPWKDTLMFCKTKKTPTLILGPGEQHCNLRARTSHLRLGLDVLAQQPLLVEGVASLPRDGVYGALVDLLLDGTQQQEERLAHRFLQDKKKGSKLRPRIPRVNLVPPTRGSCAAYMSILKTRLVRPRQQSLSVSTSIRSSSRKMRKELLLAAPLKSSRRRRRRETGSDQPLPGMDEAVTVALLDLGDSFTLTEAHRVALKASLGGEEAFSPRLTASRTH